MLKKLASAVSCIYCCSLSAVPSPFGIGLGQTTVEGISQEIIEKPILSSLENVPGYSELFLRSNAFSVNDCVPVMAKGFKNNETNTVDAIALEYRANLMYELTALLDRKYVRTYTSKKFFGGVSEIEYINGNCLIRVMKTFGGHTILFYGTIRWMNSYDENRKQLKEIRKMRRDNLERMRRAKFEQMGPGKHRLGSEKFDHHGIKHHKFNDFNHRDFRKAGRPQDDFDASFSAFDDIFSNSFDKFFDDEFFKDDFPSIKPKKILMKNKPSKNGKTYTYNFSQTYSKANDVEELKRNDNGDVTEVLKTPEKITITHNGVTKDISPEDLKSAGNIVNLAKEPDLNCGIEVMFDDNDAKTLPSSKPESECLQSPKEQLSERQCNPDPRVKYCQPPKKEDFEPTPPKAEVQSPENDLMLYGQRLDNVNL